jgi:hypothetical protein
MPLLSSMMSSKKLLAPDAELGRSQSSVPPQQALYSLTPNAVTRAASACTLATVDVVAAKASAAMQRLTH